MEEYSLKFLGFFFRFLCCNLAFPSAPLFQQFLGYAAPPPYLQEVVARRRNPGTLAAAVEGEVGGVAAEPEPMGHKRTAHGP